MSTPLRISGFSTARFATWYFLDQYRLLFDTGDGLAANLGSKCNRARHVFFSHADRDHLSGLIQFYQIAANPPAPPKFYYPKDSGSFPALREFLERFDPHLPACEWTPLEAGMSIDTGQNIKVQVGQNTHIAVATGADRSAVKSLDFSVVETRRKLRKAFQGLPGEEIARLRKEKGEAEITEASEARLFGYSGDAPFFDADRWRGTEVLVHEATFIAPDAGTRGHSELGEVIAAAATLDLKALILGHFSTRYEVPAIGPAIRAAAEKAAVSFPIYAVLPATVGWDILAGEPVWPGV